nr:immunoglobulin light chain junction region [Macaca mulatta]
DFYCQVWDSSNGRPVF